MNADLVPAVLAAGGGSALIAGIWAHEQRHDAAMRASRVRLAVRFPACLDPLAAKAALSNLSGLPSSVELLFEVAASESGIQHFVCVPAAVRASALSVLGGAMPGLRAKETASPVGRATLALRFFIPTPTVLGADHPVAAARTLLGGLTGLFAGEEVIVRWALRPDTAPSLRADEPQTRRAREIHQAWRQKTQLAGGFQAAGLVLVRAASIARARELGEHVVSAVRSRRGQIGGPRSTSERAGRSVASVPRTTRSSGWLNTAEVLPLLAWPLGEELIPGVEVGVSRELPVPRHVPREGRQLFIGRDGQGERPVALSPEAARHHAVVVGSSGVGKSVLLGRSILSDIEHGYGGAVLDPKADLVEAVLARVRPEHAERVVVLDPAAPRVPGVSVLASGGDADMGAEALTGAIRSAFTAEAWGVRTDYYLRLGLRTLAEVPGATLGDIGRLFYEESFRRHAIARLGDPFLVAAWQSYEGLSSGAQAEHLQAPMARVMALLSRPRVRAVLASPEPKLDIARLLAERKFLLVSLAPGVLGESSARLVGGAVMHVIWNAIEARAALAPTERHPLFLYLDEMATLAGGTPHSWELLAERARGLGAGLTVAVQTLGRIPEPTRSALLGNAATLITFRAGAEEAPRLARQLPGLSERDVMGLQRFEVAARVATGAGSAVTTVTGRTEPLPGETGMAAAIRARSAERYGSEPGVAPVRSETPKPDPDAPLGRAERQA